MSKEQDVLGGPVGASGDGAPKPQPHDFDVQKQIHQQIRNDPDYDDWEYGTEPLPHEAWVVPTEPASQGSVAKDSASSQA